MQRVKPEGLAYLEAVRALREWPTHVAIRPRHEWGTRQLSAYRGEYVVLNFGATWCTRCARESKDLDAIEGDYHGKRVKVIGISVNSAPTDLTLKFVKTHDLKYEILLGSFFGRDLNETRPEMKGLPP